MNNIPKPHILPYDDDYVLISKRRLVASNHTIYKMALLVSGVFNTSHAAMIVKFTRETIREVDCWTEAAIEEEIEKILDIYKQPPDKSA